MNNPPKHSSRRSFLSGSAAAGASTFMIVKPELVSGWAPAKLKAGVVGCGGRGTQAVVDMFKGDPSIDLVAMGDAFEDKLEGSLKRLRAHPDLADKQDRLKVDPDKRFTGFEAYQKVINSGVDVVILATPPGWRPIHFEAAVEANKHVFCEKPFGTDCMGVQRFMKAAKASEAKSLTVVSGAQRRSDPFYLDRIDRIHNGSIGEVTGLYAYWVGGPVIQNKAVDPKWGNFAWQHRNWYSYVWICGDQIVEQHLHNIDVCNWIMGMHPKKVVASGGTAWRPKEVLYGNIFDHIGADFEYPNGVRMSSYCRQFPRGSAENVSEIVVGSKARWTLDQAKGAPGYVNEHTKMMKSIRGDGPYVNEAMTVAESTMTCIMGREAAYSGLEITWEMVMNSKQNLQPPTADWKENATFAYSPFPVPGEYKFI
jgi:predicted dehydrogenase